jgi:hypothetical protein
MSASMDKSLPATQPLWTVMVGHDDDYRPVAHYTNKDDAEEHASRLPKWAHAEVIEDELLSALPRIIKDGGSPFKVHGDLQKPQPVTLTARATLRGEGPTATARALYASVPIDDPRKRPKTTPDRWTVEEDDDPPFIGLLTLHTNQPNRYSRGTIADSHSFTWSGWALSKEHAVSLAAEALFDRALKESTPDNG